MKISKKTLTKWANVKFGTSISQMTIDRALKKKDSFTTFDVDHLGDSKYIREVQCPKMEQATFN